MWPLSRVAKWSCARCFAASKPRFSGLLWDIPCTMYNLYKLYFHFHFIFLLLCRLLILDRVCWWCSTARKPGPVHSLTGSDWIHFTHNVNDGSFTSDGTITLPMTKSYVEQVFSRPHLSSTNEGLDCSVTLPDSPMMFQQTRSSRPVAKLKTVCGHHPTGGVSRPTSHHMDPPDPPGHWNIGDWCSQAGWGQIVLAANRRDAIASRHDDDWYWVDVEYVVYYCVLYCIKLYLNCINWLLLDRSWPTVLPG